MNNVRLCKSDVEIKWVSNKVNKVGIYLYVYIPVNNTINLFG